MNTYTADNILRIAKRFNNQKRTYLLVNPLQAKHIPVSPKASLGMMKALGDMLANKYPDTKLVIGFAETATAIGAVVAASPPNAFIYILHERMYLVLSSGYSSWRNTVTPRSKVWLATTFLRGFLQQIVSYLLMMKSLQEKL